MEKVTELLPCKMKFSIERVAPQQIYSYFVRPVFMEEWLAEAVDIDDQTEYYVLTIDGKTYQLELFEKVQNRFAKYRWIDHPQKVGQILAFQVDATTSEAGFTDVFIYDCCEQLHISLLEEEWHQKFEKLKQVLLSK